MTTGIIVEVGTKLVTTECTCGIVFAIPNELDDRLRANGNGFYCPMGHPLSYTVGKTELQKEREKRERAEASAARATQRADQAAAEAEHQRNRANGYKGAATKAKQRSAKGVCPVPGCRRHFADVERHMATKHPEFVGQKDEVTA